MLSIVIPTYNSSELLGKTLSSLSQQSSDASHYEVIVADDGSQGSKNKKLAASFSSSLDISYLHQEDIGFRAATARNLGLFHSRYERILFLDTGMICHSDLVREHLDPGIGPQDVLIGLAYGVSEFEEGHAWKISEYLSKFPTNVAFKKMSLVSKLTDCRAPELLKHNYDVAHMIAPWLFFWSGHFAAHREFLLEQGGFDDNFRSWGSEDTELSLRLFMAGGNFKVLKKILTAHYPHSKSPSNNRITESENNRYIFKKHYDYLHKLPIDINDWTSGLAKK